MKNEYFDQAAGLRRLFHVAPPEVLTAVPCGAAATSWLAHQLLARARSGRQLLALDEWSACGNLSDCLGCSPRFDLLQVVEGHVMLARCVVEALAGLHIVSASRISRALGADRVLNQRIVTQLRDMQKGYDEWLVVARSCEIAGLSPLALAAPRFLVIVDSHPMSVTEAYAMLKRHASRLKDSVVTVCAAGDTEAGRVVDNLCRVARLQLGLRVQSVSGLDEAARAIAREGNMSPAGFIDRLVLVASQPRDRSSAVLRMR